MTNILGRNFHPKWPHFTYSYSLSSPPSDTKPDVNSEYFGSLEKNLDNKDHRLLCLGISVLPVFTGWTVCPVKLSFLFKIICDASYTSTCPFGLTQYVPTDSCLDSLCCRWCGQARLLPPSIDIDIALYLHSSTSHHENSYSKYGLADCSLLFMYLSNYYRSCVYRNMSVGFAADCFTNLNLQAVDLAILHVSLDSPHSLTGFPTHWFTVFRKLIIFTGDRTKYKSVLVQYIFSLPENCSKYN